MDDALVIFTPSGKRGRFALGTPVLTAARQLGGRSGFRLRRAGHLLQMPGAARRGRVSQARRHRRARRAVGMERGRGPLQAHPRHDRRAPPWLSGQGHGRCGGGRAARKPGPQAGDPQVGHPARHRDGSRHPRRLCRGGRTRHARTLGRFRTAANGAARPVAGGRCHRRSGDPAPPATRAAQGRMEGDGRAAQGQPRRAAPHSRHLAGLSRGWALRSGHRPWVHHHRGASVRSARRGRCWPPAA
jgi:hypothetical protein